MIRWPIHFWNCDLLSWYDDTKSEYLKKASARYIISWYDDTKWNVMYPSIQKARVSWYVKIHLAQAFFNTRLFYITLLFWIRIMTTSHSFKCGRVFYDRYENILSQNMCWQWRATSLGTTNCKNWMKHLKLVWHDVY